MLEAAAGAESVPTARAGKWRRSTGRHASTFWAGLSIVLGFVAWQLVGRANHYVLPPPTDLFGAAKTAWQSGSLAANIGLTLRDQALGLAISIAVGVPLGVLMATRRRLRAVANMYLYWLFAVPEVALIPFYIVALGYGILARQFIIVLFALPVVAQRALLGASEVPANLSEMGSSFELSPGQKFWKITVPWALPSIITGIRLGFLRSLIGVVAAGIFAQLFGLGGQIWLSEQNYEVSQMYLYIAIVAIIGLLGNGLIGIVDRRFNRWVLDKPGKA